MSSCMDGPLPLAALPFQVVFLISFIAKFHAMHGQYC